MTPKNESAHRPGRALPTASKASGTLSPAPDTSKPEGTTAQAERGLLSIVLCDVARLDEVLSLGMSAEHFTDHRYEAIFRALHALHESGTLAAVGPVCEPDALHAKLGALGLAARLHDRGGAQYLRELQAETAPQSLGDYVATVRLAHNERQTRMVDEGLRQPDIDGKVRAAFAKRRQSLQDERIAILMNAGGWPEPQPLPDASETVPALAADMLPPALAGWLADIAERMQVPLEFPAIPALVAIASLVGRTVAIRPKQYDDWSEVGNLWGLVIGTPGVMKSPSMGAAMEPIKGLEKAAREQYEREHDTADSKARAARSKGLEQRITALSEAGEPEAEIDKLRDKLRALQQAVPPMKRYVTHDPTIEKLGPLLKDNPRGLLLYRDEIMGWLRMMDRDGHQSDRQFYLTAWNGKDYHSADRISRDAPLHPMCLSVIGTIQPGPLSKYVHASVAGGGGDDGFVQRFQLAVWPDIPMQFQAIDRLPDSKARERAFAVFRRIDSMLPADLGAEGTEEADGVPFLRLSQDAQPEFRRWLSALEVRLRTRDCQHEVIHAHLSKFRGLCPKLALLFHVIDCADRGSGGPVSLAAVRLGMRWCAFLEAHARRIYGAVLCPQEPETYKLATRIERGDLRDGFCVRDVQRKNWSGLTGSETIRRAIDRLVDLGWLRVRVQKTDGRDATVYFIHPKLRARANAKTDRTDRRQHQGQTATERAAC